MIGCLFFAGYYACLGFIAPELALLQFMELCVALQFTFCALLMIPMIVLLYVYYWYLNGWHLHPIAIQLSRLSSGGSWETIANAINAEFRHIDKFTSGMFILA